VVVYHGFNDLFYHAVRARIACWTEIDPDVGLDRILMRPRAVRGLIDLVGEWLWRDPCPIGHRGTLDAVAESYRGFERLTSGAGASLFVSTFAAPDPGSLAPLERDYYETELRYLWPVQGDLDAYRTRLAAYNQRVRGWAAESGVALIDVAASVTGGRDLFEDICHTTPAGRARHARVVFEALEPRVAGLVAQARGP
jgi:hypothetical protein